MNQEDQPNPQPSNSVKASSEPRINIKRIVKEFLVFLRHRLSLEEDNADPLETIEYIKKGVEFKGTNIWILIFAILIASIGLNMNSAAVIIGAMLISPLMGPIMGLGMGIGTNDFELIKKAAKNLGIMVGISVVTSTIYFFITPLNDAQSELLARTTPTIWDVMIALFGGLAGIVAGSRREKSNAIPGVAIATALMPPLCTAGYGLATGNLAYFAGAFYLFTINSVFISLSTIIIVRFLRYPTKSFVDEARERRVKRWIGIIVVVVTLPSFWIAFNLVRSSVYEREAALFVTENCVFDNAQVISKNIVSDGDSKRIELALIGQPIPEETIALLRNKLKQNKRLEDTELIIRQGAIGDKGLDMETVQMMNQSLKTGIIEDLYKRNDEALKSKDQQIQILENEVYRFRSRELPVKDISTELKAQYDDVQEFTLMRNPVVMMDSLHVDTVTFAYIQFKKRPSADQSKRLENWLKARTKSDKLKMVIQVN